MSQESSLMPRGVDDISEGDLRELAKWFRTASGERRRLLKRYKIGRQKTKALAARKQVECGHARGSMCPLRANALILGVATWFPNVVGFPAGFAEACLP